tara:strand:+ start:1597 stop:1935 length:339 start_codon:yes stop_codon:yes gene_type:complete
MAVYKATDKNINKKTTDGRYASPIKKSPPKVQKYKHGKNYKKSTDGRYASPIKKTTDGRYASPTKKIRKNDINRLPRGLRMDTTTGIGTTIIKPKMGQRIDTKKSRPKKFKK